MARPQYVSVYVHPTPKFIMWRDRARISQLLPICQRAVGFVENKTVLKLINNTTHINV